MFQSLHFHNSNTNQCQEGTFQPIVVSLWLINYWKGRKEFFVHANNSSSFLWKPIFMRIFENSSTCRWWTNFEFEVWSHQNPVKLTRKIYLRKNCEPQEKKDEESWKSSADPNNPRDPTVFLRTSRLLLFLSTLFHSSSSLFCSKSVNETSDFMVIMMKIRQWNGLGREMRFLAGDETQLLPFSRIKPWVRRTRRWGNRLSGQERWS